jgi:hypothetical protein
MKLNDEFILLPPDRFIESWLPLRRRRNFNLLDRLNAAHFDFNSDWLWWLALSSEAAFA